MNRRFASPSGSPVTLSIRISAHYDSTTRKNIPGGIFFSGKICPKEYFFELRLEKAVF